MSEILKELVLRPNPQNRGTLPELQEFLNECPDILCAGDTPVEDFQKEFSREDRYSEDYNLTYVRGHINYIYIRVKNNSSDPVEDIFAELFYCDEEHVSSVSNWKRIPVENRETSQSGNRFGKIESGAIGVVEAPFMLPPDLDVNTRFCLIARIWGGNEKYRNPLPNKMNPTSIESLLAEHLLWGQKKILVNRDYDYPCSFASVNLSISSESTSGETDTYALVLRTKNVAGRNIKAEIRNSRTDDKGEQIQLSKAEIDRDLIMIGPFTLKKGYSSQLTLYIYRPKNQQPDIEEEYMLSVYRECQKLDHIEPLIEKNEHSQLICEETFRK